MPVYTTSGEILKVHHSLTAQRAVYHERPYRKLDGVLQKLMFSLVSSVGHTLPHNVL